MNIREAVKQAIASHEQEGFVFTAKELAALEKVAAGEMTTEEYRQEFLKVLTEIKEKHPEVFVEGS